VRERLCAAGRIDDDALVQAEDVRRAFTVEVDALLADHDAIALPTLSCPPPTLAEAADPAAAIPMTAFCRPFNLSGHPAIALPVGEIADRPLSLQLVGRRGADEALCAIARAIPNFIKGKTA
jgi:amidase